MLGFCVRSLPESVSLCMSWLLLPLAAFGFAWLAVVALLATCQRRLLYRPQPSIRAPDAAGAGWMRAVPSASGGVLGWWSPPADDKDPVLVVFHGNRGTLPRIAAKMRPWRNSGLGLFAATYRGFEGNPGQPCESGLYDDGRAVLDWLKTCGIEAGRVILYGESLGSGVAVQLACEHAVRGVVLEAPFSSITAAATARYPWAPVRLLAKDRFDNLSKIGRLAMPLLILHGEDDRTMPIAHGRRLAAAAPSNARFVALPQAGHLDLFERGAGSALLAFLADINGR
jgi:fermentation-respiration switch protein FrsA (DUF1100 family)